ncbi:MAG: DUF4351 domain-containing protein [Pirellulaceae bacterium]|nr:DUF4351 domain-containing protein [Pirellulaceae bacterium]
MKSQDHDQRIKTLLKEFIQAFFDLFLPQFASLFDFSQVTWLENEAFPDPLQGKRKSLDLVARLPLRVPIETGTVERIESMMAIVHCEVDADSSVQPLRLRMFNYFANLRQKYAEPILPVAVYLNVGLGGIGLDRYQETFGDFDILRYTYWYVGLPALDAEQYLNQANPLGIALSALMRVPTDHRPEFKALALKRVLECSENEYRRFLLAECIQAYLPLTLPEDKARFEQVTMHDSYTEVRTMATTWFEEGIEKGIERGIEQGERQFALKMLAKRFGNVTEEARQKVAQWPLESLAELIDRAYQIDSLESL